MTACAIYVRVSTDKQIGSVDHQISYLKEFAKVKGQDWYVNDNFIYEDAGISGTEIYQRPAVLRLIEDAKRGLFDVVLFKGISRFSRDMVDAQILIRQLTSFVRVISAEEGYDSTNPQSNVIFGIHSIIAQYESEKNGIRVRMGYNEIAKRGQWPTGTVPIGYKLNRETRKLVPDEDRMRTVQMIFDMYVHQGFGMRRIAAYLNDHGMLTQTGELWHPTKVRKVLTNRVYIGDLIYGKERVEVRQDPTNPLKHQKARSRERDDMIVVHNAHPAIVDNATFEMAQKIMSKRGESGANKGGSYLLSGILICPKCGSKMYVKKRTVMTSSGKAEYYYYICSKRLNYGSNVCSQDTIRAEKIEDDVLSLLRFTLSDYTYEALREKNLAKAVVTVKDKLEQIEKQIEAIEQELLNLNRKNAQGLIPDRLFAKMLSELDERQSKLESERNQLISEESSNTTLEQELSAFDKAVRRFKQLQKVNRQNVTRARMILEQLTNGITFDKDGDIDLNLKFEWNT